MATVAEAKLEMFEDVHRLLRRFDNARITEPLWRRLFEHAWGGPAEAPGHVLLDGARIVGFIGLVFSRRDVQSEPRSFCNLTSWIVDPAFRKESLRLLGPLAALKEHTITNLSVTPELRGLFKMSGFRVLDERGSVVFPFLTRLRGDITTDVPCIRSELSSADRRILDDHLPYRCSHVLLRSSGRSCYVVAKSERHWRVPVSRVHYVSDPELLLANANRVAWALAKQDRTVATLIDARFTLDQRPRLARSYPFHLPKLFRSKVVDRCDVGSIYSECILLTA